MKIESYILEYLRQFGKVEIPSFGSFHLRNVQAKIIAEQNSILPPSKEIIWKENTAIYSEELLNFIVHKTKISAQLVAEELNKKIVSWKEHFQKREHFEIENIGKFNFSNSEVQFFGINLNNESPDYYGLEAIGIQNISEKKHNSIQTLKQEEQYSKKTNRFLWLFFVVFPLLGIAVLVYFKRDLLFGKKSFENLSVGTKSQTLKPDTIKQNIVKDSIISDSLKSDSIKNLAVPVRKLIYKKNYKNKKWHKAKRRVNR